MGNIIEKIKLKNWDNRVQRPGFLQSKQIVVEAICREITLTDGVFIFNKSNIWIEDSALYDSDFTDYLFGDAFPKAFDRDPFWPKEIFNQLERRAKDLEVLSSELKEVDWEVVNRDEKFEFLKRYVDVLIEIQKYYALAVPLTNYCEKIIKDNDESLLDFAVQFESLDVDRLNESLCFIKEVKDRGENIDELIDAHIAKFGWIKTNYNIVERYTKSDVLSELKSDIHVFKPLVVPEGELRHIVIGLQIGIYLRNRMKELSQQIWFSYDDFAKQLASDLGINKEDYLQLTYKEVFCSLDSNKLVVDIGEIRLRHHGFVVGILNGEDVLLTGVEVKGLFDYYNNHDVQGVNHFKGNIACKGFVKGIVKVVKDISGLKKLNEGDVLVTSMTTPDFIVGMKIASAFITDEGGLSCHAAIVSREMKKPCIIGTKIATKVLKDGDLVEVDANAGVVKIIKKV